MTEFRANQRGVFEISARKIRASEINAVKVHARKITTSKKLICQQPFLKFSCHFKVVQYVLRVLAYAISDYHSSFSSLLRRIFCIFCLSYNELNTNEKEFCNRSIMPCASRTLSFSNLIFPICGFM